jgi:hypothetical protein
MNKTLTLGWDNRELSAYDDLFTFAERDQMYDYALNLKYTVNRLNSEIPSQSAFPTLKASVPFIDLIKLNFLKREILDVIKNYRLRDAYVNLGTASDKYFFHVDSPFAEDLTLLYYVNTDWQDSWEGQTHFSNESGTLVNARVDFKPGRLVVFDSTIPHTSTKPTVDSGTFRYSLVLKLSKINTPRYVNSIPIHDFFIKEIVVSDEEQQCIDFVKTKFGHVNHSLFSLADHLIGVFKVAKSLGLDQETCFGALLHSAYSTAQFQHDTKITRQELVELVGPNCENLIYQFCTLDQRLDTLLNNFNNFDMEIRIKLLSIEYCNLIEQYPRSGRDLENICKIRHFLDQNKLTTLK